MSKTHTSIATWSWRAAWEASKDGRLVVQPVRISRGVPKFWPAAETFPEIPELAPDGPMFSMTAERFEVAYRAKLDRLGVDLIQARLDATEAETDRGLALCCFEADRQRCHRGTWAWWWLEQTGVEVRELTGPQLTIAEAGR